MVMPRRQRAVINHARRNHHRRGSNDYGSRRYHRRWGDNYGSRRHHRRGCDNYGCRRHHRRGSNDYGSRRHDFFYQMYDPGCQAQPIVTTMVMSAVMMRTSRSFGYSGKHHCGTSQTNQQLFHNFPLFRFYF